MERKIRLAINGFGRIGRVVTRSLKRNPNIELVAINDLTPSESLAHLLKYDSVHRNFEGTVEVGEGNIQINDKVVYVYNCKDPEQLPWGELNIDVVIESTGVFRTRELASKHLAAGAKKVVLSAPAKSNDIQTVVLGINDEVVQEVTDLLSNASCTTNCAAPMVKIIDDALGIKQGFLTTVHAYTADQRLHDAPHRDLRRARAAAESIVPTTTGAANALIKIFPHLHGKLSGNAIRVPVPSGSLTELTFMVEQDATVSEINKLFKGHAKGKYKHVLDYTTDPIVSTDIIGNPYSCIFDAGLTMVNGKMIKVVGWYDNEAGYSNRLVDLVGLWG